MSTAPLTLTGLRLWDGDADAPGAEHVALRIESGRIASIGPAAELRAGAEVRDFDGAFAIPGLIDAHVHLCLDPEIGSPEAQDEVPADERARALDARAAAMLRAGITSARDLGGGAAGFELALRERIARGQVEGPRLLCAGQPLTTPRGHCWFWGGEVDGPEAARAAIARQAERGCEWIKVMASGGVITRGTRAADAQFPTEMLALVVETARAHGRPVAAHAHATEAIRNAAEAGVASVEHCSFVGAGGGFGSGFDPAVVALLAERGVAVSPTVNAGWQRYAPETAKSPVFFERMCAALRALRDAGVSLIASTDAGIPNVAHDQLPRALAVFARFAGLSPTETLRSATSRSADALGLAALTGRLRPGLSADLVVLADDPTRDLAALMRPLAVVGRGALSSLAPSADA